MKNIKKKFAYTCYGSEIQSPPDCSECPYQELCVEDLSFILRNRLPIDYYKNTVAITSEEDEPSKLIGEAGVVGEG